MLIFRDNDGNLRVNPCLEINVRLNMGLLSLHIEKLVSPGKKGIFRTFFQPGTSFMEFKKRMETSYPLKALNGKIESGFFALTPAHNDSKFGAFLLVDE